MSTVTDTIVATAEQLLPTLLSAASVSSPAAAGITALAPVAMQLMQSAMQLHSAGAMSADQLATLFGTIGAGVQTTHDQWAALNAKPV